MQKTLKAGLAVQVTNKPSLSSTGPHKHVPKRQGLAYRGENKREASAFEMYDCPIGN